MTSDIAAWLLSYAQAHQQLVYGAIAGAVLTHPALLALGMFNLAVKVPGVGPWIAAHPDEAKAFADGFDKAIDMAIDKYARKPVSGPPAAP